MRAAGLLVAGVVLAAPLLAGCIELRYPEPSFRTLSLGQGSAITEPLRLVITSEEAWRAHWEAHYARAGCPDGTRSCHPDAPAVDFDRERVLAVHGGEMPNTCNAIRILSLREEPERIVVEVATYSAPPDVGCAHMLVHPFHFAAIPLDARAAAFETRNVAASPPP